MAQGANIFMLSLVLQAIYLPLHGVPYEDTPLLAGLYLLPNSIANAIFSPIGGRLVNKLGSRVLSTLGALLVASSFELLTLLPIDFNYAVFAAVVTLLGAGFGLFMSPNLVSIMNSVPIEDRSAASGLRLSLQNMGTLISFALFLTLLIISTSEAVPTQLYNALVRNGMPQAIASQLIELPTSVELFAAFLGYNPLQAVLGHAQLDPIVYSRVTSPTFFPEAVAEAVKLGIDNTYHVAAALALTAAIVSYMRDEN
jgi:MFS family permease